MNLLRLMSGNTAVTRSSGRLAPKPPLRVVGDGEVPGRGASWTALYAVRFTALLGEATLAAMRVLRNPSRFHGGAFFHHIGQTGLRAVPAVALVCLLAGAVVMQQGVVVARTVNAELYAAQMLGVLALRDMGVLLASIVVAARSAAAFAAEIGALSVHPGLEAMRGRGDCPVETLVLPRLLALMVAMPLLVFIADIMCLAGGAVIAAAYSGLDIGAYAGQLHGAATSRHFLVGLVKAPLAALAIGLAGCLEGMGAPSGVAASGGHEGRAVVKAVLLLMVCGAAFTMFLTLCGI